MLRAIRATTTGRLACELICVVDPRVVVTGITAFPPPRHLRPLLPEHEIHQ